MEKANGNMELRGFWVGILLDLTKALSFTHRITSMAFRGLHADAFALRKFIVGLDSDGYESE